MTDAIRVGVVGARGRMGQQVCQAVLAAADLALVAQVDLDDSLSTLVDSRVQVMVDFTHPDSALDNVKFAAAAGIRSVVGTSGFTEEKLREASAASIEHGDIAVAVIPNFGIGAVLSIKFAELAAPYFESAEIIELHHAGKADAPSGTATHTARAISQARNAAGSAPIPDATTSALDGARGAEVDGVRIHSVRLAGLVAHQEILFGTTGETLTIRHDSLDRSSFMPGVLLAIRQISSRSGLIVGLDSFLGL